MRERKTAPTEGNKSEQNTTISPATGLTPQQEQACILLASGESYTATAQRLNINRGTLYKWQDSLPFQCFYNQQCSDYKAEVRNALFGLHSEAVETVRELMQTGGEATRLKAAIWLLEKVEAVEIGTTDVRAALKEQNTEDVIDLSTKRLNYQSYRQALKEMGLCEEEIDLLTPSDDEVY